MYPKIVKEKKMQMKPLSTFLIALFCVFYLFCLTANAAATPELDDHPVITTNNTDIDIILTGNERFEEFKDKVKFVPGQLIVKYKSSVTYSVREIVRQGERFEDHVVQKNIPQSTSKKMKRIEGNAQSSGATLDALHFKYGVKRAKPIFRLEAEEDSIVGPKSLKAIQQLHQNRVSAVINKKAISVAMAIQTKNLPDLSQIYTLDIDPETDVFEAALDFQKDPNVEYAHPNYIASSMFVPNDPYYSSSGAWGQAFDDLWGLKIIQTEQAWDVNQGDDVVVAVVDTGVDYNHPDIASNMLPGINCVNELNECTDDDPMDDHGHGTHVAGTIAAEGNNGIGVVGVAPQAKILPVKALDQNGSGDFATLAAALQYAADSGAEIINNSWGCSWCGQIADIPEIDPEFKAAVYAVEDAVRYAYAMGAVVVFAAGNDSLDIKIGSPARVAEALTVAAFDHNDERATFSNTGFFDVAAPGGGGDEPEGNCASRYSVLSLKSEFDAIDNNPDCSLEIGGDYMRLAGTSMAAPHVSGLAALLLKEFPTLTNEQVRQAIRRGADDVGEPGFEKISGYGRINAVNSLYEAEINPLSVRLTSVEDLVLDSTPFEVFGLVGGENLARWRLEFAHESSPGEWISLIDWQYLPVESPDLLAELSPSAMPQGINEIRLVAETITGDIYEDRRETNLYQIRLSEPRGISSLYRFVASAGDPVNIVGRVAPYGLVNYTVNIYREDGTVLEDAAITLVNGGTQPIVDDFLAVWDTGGVPEGTYGVEVEMLQDSGETSLTIEGKVLLDSTLHSGWPKSVAIQGQIRKGDVNGNGVDEIILLDSGIVTVLDHSGNALPGWPQEVQEGTTYASMLAIGNLHGDSASEIVVPNDTGELFVFSGDGNVLAGWPQNIDGGISKVAIADISSNGVNDIIISTNNSDIYVYDNAGNLIDGWPVTDLASGQTVKNEIAVADIDADGKHEIVFLLEDNDLRLFVFEEDGSLKDGWPEVIAIGSGFPILTCDQSGLETMNGWIRYPCSSNIAVGNLDGDIALEIIAANGSTVFAYNFDSSLVTGWPVSTDRNINSIGLGDVTGDYRLNVIADSFIHRIVENETVQLQESIFVLDKEGQGVPGWPVRYDGLDIASPHGGGAPLITDITDDGVDDIVLGLAGIENRNPNALHAFNGNGQLLDGFPKKHTHLSRSSEIPVLVSDLDSDGKLELIWMDRYSLYVWDLEVFGDASGDWNSTYGDAANTSALTSNAGAPMIESFAPLEGPIGTLGSIIGSGFCTDNCGQPITNYSDMSVSFNGAEMIDGYVVSPTLILFQLPEEATTGPITVTTPEGSISSNPNVFSVTPTFTSFMTNNANPQSGSVGDFVMIYGTGLEGLSTEVFFQGSSENVSANVIAGDHTFVMVQVPSGAVTGPLTVITQGGSVESSPDIFLVTPTLRRPPLVNR